jgi:hypothetical protein
LRGWSAWNPDGSCAAGRKVDNPLMGNHDARARLIVPARAAPVPLGWGWGGLRREGLSRSCTVTADQPDAILAVADDLHCRRGGVWAPSGVPCRSGGGSGASPAPSITRAANGAPLVGGRFQLIPQVAHVPGPSGRDIEERGERAKLYHSLNKNSRHLTPHFHVRFLMTEEASRAQSTGDDDGECP